MLDCVPGWPASAGGEGWEHEEASGTRAVRAPEGGPRSHRLRRDGSDGLQGPQRERGPHPRLPAHGLPFEGQLARVASLPEGRVPEVSFLEFRDQAGLDRRRVPLEGTLETTYRCNLACVHCYVNLPAGSREARQRELSLDRLFALVDEIVEEGSLFVLFTGGEVLVRPDFPQLYLHARSKGLLVTIFTNGTLVTDAVADLLAEHPPEKVEISLYGMTKETYERVTRVPGSVEKCLAGMRRLVGRGLPLT